MQDQEENKTIKTVAIQGGYGAFHEIAAQSYFENEELNIEPCDTFNDLFDAVEFDRADCAVMAIENSVAGSIVQNYTLLRDHDMCIYGEVYLRIEQNLVALPGVELENVKEIYSHPMAIQQCLDYLNPLRHQGVRVIDAIDTALSAKYIQDEKLETVAAITSGLAAEMYGMNVLAKGIETNKKNFTRFLVISKPDKLEYKEHVTCDNTNKASLSFVLPHEEGSLSKVLSVLHSYHMNLSKIQSVPIVGKFDEFLFYIDILFDGYDKYQQVLAAIKPLTTELDILGEYVKGERPHDNKTS